MACVRSRIALRSVASMAHRAVARRVCGPAPALAACDAAGALGPAHTTACQRRTFARSARSSPKAVSYSKQLRKKRAPAIHNNKYTSCNDPRLMPKMLRFADRKAADLGSDAALREFDEASAAFGNPCPVVAATILERGPVTMRAPETWEREYLEFAAAVDDRYRKEYPAEFVERQLAFVAKLEAEDGGGSAFDAAKLAAPVVGADDAGGQYDQFYSNDQVEEDDEKEIESEADFQPLARETHADKINDQRSLDRLLQERLVLLVQRNDGSWTLPQTVREEGETMVDAARRGLADAWGGNLDAWYPGNAPVGHMLQPYAEGRRSLEDTYGAKVFLYRAVLMRGKLALSGEYTDYRWVHREEAGEYLEAEEYAYLYQVMGGDRPTDGSPLGGFEAEE